MTGESTSIDRLASLRALLDSLYSADDLRQFVITELGRTIHSELPSDGPPQKLIFDLTEVLERRGLIDERLFEALVRTREARRSEIEAVKAELCAHDEFRALDEPSINVPRNGSVPQRHAGWQPTRGDTPTTGTLPGRDERDGAPISAAWLQTYSDVIKALRAGRSVNLISTTNATMRAFVHQLESAESTLCALTIVDLDAGATATRKGLIRKMLQAVKLPAQLDGSENPLEVFEDRLEALANAGHPAPTIAFLHGGHVASRNYGSDLFRSLRYCTQTQRWLVLLFCSTMPIDSLIPENELSSINWLPVRIGAGEA